jgi:hypothetical protein
VSRVGYYIKGTYIIYAGHFVMMSRKLSRQGMFFRWGIEIMETVFYGTSLKTDDEKLLEMAQDCVQ